MRLFLFIVFSGFFIQDITKEARADVAATQEEFDAAQDEAAKEHAEWLNQVNPKGQQTNFWIVNPIREELKRIMFIEDFGTDDRVWGIKLHDSCPQFIRDKWNKMKANTADHSWASIAYDVKGKVDGNPRNSRIDIKDLPYGTIRVVSNTYSGYKGVTLVEVIEDKDRRVEILAKRREEIRLLREGKISETSWQWVQRMIKEGEIPEIDDHYPVDYTIEEVLKKIDDEEEDEQDPEELPVEITNALEIAHIQLAWFTKRNLKPGVDRWNRVISTLQGTPMMQISEAKRHMQNSMRWRGRLGFDTWNAIIEAFKVLETQSSESTKDVLKEKNPVGEKTPSPVVQKAIDLAKQKLVYYQEKQKKVYIYLMARMQRVLNTLETDKHEMSLAEAKRYLSGRQKARHHSEIRLWEAIIAAFEELGVQ